MIRLASLLLRLSYHRLHSECTEVLLIVAPEWWGESLNVWHNQNSALPAPERLAIPTGSHNLNTLTPIAARLPPAMLVGPTGREKSPECAVNGDGARRHFVAALWAVHRLHA
jgi:hypothetical protein